MKVRRTMIDPIDLHIGSRLRLARLLAGMSQNEVGKSYGVSFQQIQKNERGINRVSASGLVRFAKILGVPLLYFYEGLPSGYMNGDNAKIPLPVSPLPLSQQRETLDLVRAYCQIANPEQRRAFAHILKIFIEKTPSTA